MQPPSGPSAVPPGTVTNLIKMWEAKAKEEAASLQGEKLPLKPQEIQEKIQPDSGLHEPLSSHQISVIPESDLEKSDQEVKKEIDSSHSPSTTHQATRSSMAKIVRLIKLFFAHLMSEGVVNKMYDKGFISPAENRHELALFPTALTNRLLEEARGTTRGTSHELGSQGWQISFGKSRVLLHESTVPKNEYGPVFRNMDRGIVGQKEGLNYGVVCDGAGSELYALQAAQSFAETIAKGLDKYSKELRVDLNAIKDEDEVEKASKELVKQAAQIFNEAASSIEVAGGATVVFATFGKTSSDSFFVNGAAVGDCAAIHIDRNQLSATQLNTVTKQDPHNKKDSGGQICAGVSNNEDISNASVFCQGIAKEDVVILTSDGLVDNIYEGQLEKIIPLIIFNSKFDASVDQLLSEQQPWLETNPPSLPSEDQLKQFTRDSKINADVDNVTIAKRLNNYVKFVTHAYAQMGKEVNDFEKAIKERTDIDKDEKKGIIDANRKKIHAEQKFASKTDDTMIVVLSPTGN